MGPGYETLLMQLIPGDIYSACPYRHLHTIPGLLDSQTALSNSYSNACMPSREVVCTYLYDGLWYDPARTPTHDLPCERRTFLPLRRPYAIQMVKRIVLSNMIFRFVLIIMNSLTYRYYSRSLREYPDRRTQPIRSGCRERLSKLCRDAAGRSRRRKHLPEHGRNEQPSRSAASAV